MSYACAMDQNYTNLPTFVLGSYTMPRSGVKGEDCCSQNIKVNHHLSPLKTFLPTATLAILNLPKNSILEFSQQEWQIEVIIFPNPRMKNGPSEYGNHITTMQ